MKISNCLIGIFFNFDIYHYCIREYKLHSIIVYPLSLLLSILIQTGVFIGPIVGMTIPNNWKLLYRITLGAILGMFLSALKDLFTDAERHRELKEMKDKLHNHEQRHNQHEQRLSGHEQRLSGHEQRLSGHEQRLSGHEQRHNQHEQRLSGHEQRHNQHEQRLSGHDYDITLLRHDVEMSKPFIYEPFDPPSPK